ncbi:GntR family transcriptional regulator [Microbacterium luteolum]|uniref:FCD domain-containing protein n=1 Tax=Microbacterium luteolum TaxID=69367 RepID=A0ABY7XPJ2_MICLT|nr:FCD domain-containing protein [Microbacterium luteolum]WDM41828.1 FCD domain-containing protein [Microbacterium luteolum]
MTETDETLIDRITDRLITAVAIGEFLPGARLPAERDLARSLGVGRTTTRAALERLVGRGILEKQRGRSGGSFVTEEWPSSEVAAVARWFEEQWPQLVDAAIAGTHLHGAIARLAASNRTDDDIERLEKRLDDFRQAESGAARQQADSILHLAIIAAAHNETLSAIVLDHERRFTIIAPAHPWGDSSSRPAMEERAGREHGELVAAIVDGRVDDAGRIAQRHVEIDLELLDAARRRALTR